MWRWLTLSRAAPEVTTPVAIQLQIPDFFIFTTGLSVSARINSQMVNASSQLSQKQSLIEIYNKVQMCLSSEAVFKCLISCQYIVVFSI